MKITDKYVPISEEKLQKERELISKDYPENNIFVDKNGETPSELELFDRSFNRDFSKYISKV